MTFLLQLLEESMTVLYARKEASSERRF